MDGAYDREALQEWALGKWERWVVERSFGWLGGYLRLSKDYEQLCGVSEAWLWLAFVVILTRRLTRRSS